MNKFRKSLRALSFRLKSITGILELQHQTQKLNELVIDDYLQKHLYHNPQYRHPKKLTQYEYQVFSQSGSDGIINEIFKRIKPFNQYFVEFGAANGLWNNSVALLIKDWKGLWLESDRQAISEIENKYTSMINQKKLKILETFVTAENIENIFKKAKVPKEFDLLSIDIDGNDYWVWKAITKYTPRLVIIEYNAKFAPDIKWVMKYNPKHLWDKSSYLGASLKSLELLGKNKGYQLVGCDFLGINAFFVRQDLVKDKFLSPFTAENHYEPPRYFLLRTTGHPNNFGDFENI